MSLTAMPDTPPTVTESAWRYRVAIVMAVIIATLTGYHVTALLPPTYEATAALLLSDAQDPAGRLAGVERYTAQEGNRLTSRAVAQRAAHELGPTVSADDVRRLIDVDVDPAVGLLAVTAESRSAARAADVANAVILAYEHVTREAITTQAVAATQALRDQADALLTSIGQLEAAAVESPTAQRRVELLRAQLVVVETKIGEIEAEAALQAANLGAVERASAPVAPSSPRPVRNSAIAGVAALVLASALAHARAVVLHRRRPDLGGLLGAPMLAEIPRFARPPEDVAGGASADLGMMEAYQFLATAFDHVVDRSDIRSVLITSAALGDGKSVTAFRLAFALGTQGRNVVLVDADLRARGLTAILGREGRPGLVAFAEGRNLDDVIERYRVADDAALHVIPAGSPPEHPTGLLATEGYREAIAKITAYNDMTIIDGTPLLMVADASAVAAQVDGVLLVIDERTPAEDVQKVRQRLRLTQTPLIGYVRNRVPDQRRLEYPYHVDVASRRHGVFRRLMRRLT